MTSSVCEDDPVEGNQNPGPQRAGLRTYTLEGDRVE